MRKDCRKGQSILEYTLLLGAIIAVLIAVLLNEGGVRNKVQATYTKAGESLTNTINSLDDQLFAN